MGHRIIFGAYRDWALDVLEFVEAHPTVESVYHVRDNDELDIAARAAVRAGEDVFVMLCGWSGQPTCTDVVPVFSEHPVSEANSDRYSLGTPLQNQILDGVTRVKHRLVKVSDPELIERSYCDEVDMSLCGNMDNILDQMRATAINLFDRFLNTYPNVHWKQWPAIDPLKMVKPRTPGMSILNRNQLSAMSTKQLYDFCRMLEEPYPRAQVEDAEGILTFEKVMFKAK